MIYKYNGRSVSIPEEEIEKLMKNLDITEQEAIELWLDDNGYTVNEEQVILNEKAKDYRIQLDVISENKNNNRKSRTVKISDEKKQLFHLVYSALLELGSPNVEILKEYKLFQCKIGEKVFKVDLIEQRPPKK